MSRGSRRRHLVHRSHRWWWAVLIALFGGGLALWALGLGWAAPLPGIALLGFVVLSWLEVRPQGGHVHDTGLHAYGVAEPPRITPDRGVNESTPRGAGLRGTTR